MYSLNYLKMSEIIAIGALISVIALMVSYEIIPSAAEKYGTEISDKVIFLRTAIDVVIVDETVYMLTLAGENLFNMERAYKAVYKKQITNITDSNIINDAEAFSSVASYGHDPRKFVSFNELHLQKLKDANSRKRISKKFNIPLDGDKFDMSQLGAADKLVKLLYDRGMVDPFDNNPMEVSSSKKWE